MLFILDKSMGVKQSSNFHSAVGRGWGAGTNRLSSNIVQIIGSNILWAPS